MLIGKGWVYFHIRSARLSNRDITRFLGPLVPDEALEITGPSWEQIPDYRYSIPEWRFVADSSFRFTGDEPFYAPAFQIQRLMERLLPEQQRLEALAHELAPEWVPGGSMGLNIVTLVNRPAGLEVVGSWGLKPEVLHFLVAVNAHVKFDLVEEWPI